MINFKITKPKGRKKNYTLTIDNSKSNVPVEYANEIAVSVIGSKKIMRNSSKIIITKVSPETFLPEIRKKIYSPANVIEGGIGANRTIDDLAKKYNVRPIHYKKIYAAIDAGIGVEKEHSPELEKMKEIAFDHLWETGMLYYQELSKMEKKLESNPVKFEKGAEVGDDNDRMRMLALKAKADADALALLELEAQAKIKMLELLELGETKVETDEKYGEKTTMYYKIKTESLDKYLNFLKGLKEHSNSVKVFSAGIGVEYLIVTGIYDKNAAMHPDISIDDFDDYIFRSSMGSSKNIISFKRLNSKPTPENSYNGKWNDIDDRIKHIQEVLSEEEEVVEANVHPETAPQKEAWEMTLNEFAKSREKNDRLVEILRSKKEWQSISDDYSDKLKRGIWKGKINDSGVDLELFAQEMVSNAQENIERLKKGILDETSIDRINRIVSSEHKKSIKQAISEGKPVPAEVLADYPELQKSEPETFAKGSFRTIEFTDGIKAVVGCPVEKMEDGKKVGGKKILCENQNNKYSIDDWENNSLEIIRKNPNGCIVLYHGSINEIYVHDKTPLYFTPSIISANDYILARGDFKSGEYGYIYSVVIPLKNLKVVDDIDSLERFSQPILSPIENGYIRIDNPSAYELKIVSDNQIKQKLNIDYIEILDNYSCCVNNDIVSEQIRMKRDFLGNPVELGKYVYSDIDENNTKAEQGMKINDGTILYRVTKNENLTKENIRLPFHAGTLEQAERIADIKDYGNDAVYYKIILDENARIYTTSDTVANILDKEIRKEITVSIGKNILNDCISVVMRNVKTNEIIPFINTNGEATPFVNLEDKDASDFLYLHENSDYDAIRYENEIEGDGYSYLILTDKFKIEKMSGTKAEKGMKIDADINGGAAYEGYLHTDGGIPATVKETGQEIEFEVGEIVINRVDAQKHCEELSKINSEHGKKIDCECLRNSNKDENLKDPKMKGAIDESGMVKLEKGDSIDKNMEKTLSNEGNIIQDTIENQEVEIEEMEAATMFKNGGAIRNINTPFTKEDIEREATIYFENNNKVVFEKKYNPTYFFGRHYSKDDTGKWNLISTYGSPYKEDVVYEAEHERLAGTLNRDHSKDEYDMFENGDKIGGKQRHYKFRDDSFFVVDWVEQDGKQVAVLVDKQPRNKWFSIGESSADQILEDAKKEGLSFDEMLKTLIQNGAFVNIHAEGAAISNEYPHPFVKAIDEQIIKAGKEYRAIEDAIYGLAGDRNKQKRQEVISAIVGDKVPAAKSGISAIEEELKKWILAKYPNANVTKRFEPILKEEAKADTTEKEAWEMTLDEYVEEKSKGIPEGSISDLRAEFHNEYYNAIQKHLESNGQISQRVYEQLDPVFKNRTVAKYRNPISGTEPKTETIPENIPIEVAKSKEYQEAYRKYEMGLISSEELENFRNLPKVETVGRYVLGMEWEEDFPNADMLETGKKAKINWGVENLKKLADSFTDNNFHTAVKPLYAAISYLKKDMKGEAEKELKAFRAHCEMELNGMRDEEEMKKEIARDNEPDSGIEHVKYDAEYEADIVSRFEKALENFAETKNKDFIVRKYGDNSQTVEGTLNEYITEIVVKANQPQKLETYYSLLEKAGYAKNKADMRFLYTYINNDDEIGSIDRLANFTIFSNSGINLFELIPDKFKKTQSVKTVSYRLDHKDEGLKSILKSFAGKDNIRPILGGIHFDEHGVVVTDAQKLAFINGKVKETGTYCITKDCFEAYTDEKGKLHQPIEKYPLGEHNKYPAYVGVIPYNNSERNVISTIGIEIYANAMMKSGLLNDSFLSTAYKIGETAIYLDAERVLDCIKFMRQLGYDKIEISASTSTRGVLFMPVGGAVKAHHLDNPFALLMPLFSEGFNEGTVYFDCNDETVKVYSEKKGIPEIVITPDYLNVKELEKTKKQLREETESVKKQLKDEVEQAKALAKAELEAEKERLKREKNDEAKRKADEKIKADMAAARAKKTKEDAENARKEAEEKAELEKKESSEANDKNRMRMLALKAKADADALALLELEMEMEDGIDVSSPIGIETQIENVLSGSESDSEKKAIEKKVEYARKNISNIKKMNGSKVYDLSIEQNEFDVWIFRYNLKKTGKSTGQKYYYPVQFAEIEYVENMGNVAFDAYKYAVKNNLYKKYHDDITGMVSEYLEAYNISANENEIKEISEKFSLTLIDVIMYSGVVYSEDALNFGTSEEYLEFLKNKSKSKRSEAIERVANISPARRLYTEIKPKNKKEEVYFDKADALYDAIEKYYDPNYFTESNVSKSMILSKERSYPTKRGTLKEGIMIKNLPYSGYFKVNVFAIYGETTFDAGEGKLYGGKQVGRILTYQGLPTKDELIDDMILIYLVEMQKPEMISDEGSKSGRTKLFPKTKDFITAKNYKDYLDVKIPDEWLTNESTEEINKLQEFDEK